MVWTNTVSTLSATRMLGSLLLLVNFGRLFPVSSFCVGISDRVTRAPSANAGHTLDTVQ
jgi:hypothetical protein